MSKKCYRDKRTGAIGVHRYDELLKMIYDGLTAPEIANRLNVNCETVRKFARRRGMTIKPKEQTLENHPCWTGGLTKDRSGYILQRVRKDSDHSYLIRAIAKRGRAGTDSAGYAPVHRIVMHNKLGRKLRRGEIVDHIDGDIENNAPENLRVFPSNAAHLRETLAGKVPKWSQEGYQNMCNKSRECMRLNQFLKVRGLSSTHYLSKNDGRTLLLSYVLKLLQRHISEQTL
jgi:hypothetical protein